MNDLPPTIYVDVEFLAVAQGDFDLPAGAEVVFAADIGDGTTASETTLNGSNRNSSGVASCDVAFPEPLGGFGLMVGRESQKKDNEVDLLELTEAGTNGGVFV